MQHSFPRVSRRTFLAGTAATLAATASRHAAADSEQPGGGSERKPRSHVLHFQQPASKWPNALPVGNGRLGAVAFGVPGLDRLQLNEESIWDGEPNRDRTNPRARKAIPRIRELLFDGKIGEAQELAVSDVLSLPRRMPCYQTLGDLHLDFSPMGLTADAPIEDYRLELDLDAALVTTTFRHEGITYRREVFSSVPDQVIVMRLTADARGKLHVRLNLDRPHNFSTAQPAKDRLTLTGQALPVNDNPNLPVKEHQTGVRFYAELRALAEGAHASSSQASDKAVLEISDADSITLLIDCATSYRYPAHAGKTSGVDADVLTGDPAAMRAAVDRNLSAAARRSFVELRTRHVEDHRRYFRRADFNLGPDPNAAIPTDVRVKAMKAGEEDIHMFPLFFQYGRYLLISSSRPGTLAATLQGIWNESVDPPWGSKYTVNINAEMNYWMAEAANLSECILPYFDLLTATKPEGELTAQSIYGARGLVVHHNTDIWGDAGPIDGLGGGVWPMGASWMSLHLWRHFEFTGDRRFLLEQVYPALRLNAMFLLDYMVGDPHTGFLTTGPSCSPENYYELPDGKSYNLCMGPTMDISIVRSIFARILETGAVLQHEPAITADAPLLQRVRDAWSQIPPFRIGHDGRIQEWSLDYTDHEPGHRHISHLFGLFPEDQITVEGTPELAHAARIVLNKRLENGGGSTGWSRSWIVNCMARLGDGEACYANLRELFRQSVRPNLFDVCGLKENSPFQIDGNLGAPNGMIEMLLQSHGETPLTPPADMNEVISRPVTLRMLPALPQAWPEGTARGLIARGGVEIDLVWQSHQLSSATLRTSRAADLLIVAPKGQSIVSLYRNGHPEPIKRTEEGNLRLQARRGARYEMAFA